METHSESDKPVSITASTTTTTEAQTAHNNHESLDGEDHTDMPAVKRRKLEEHQNGEATHQTEDGDSALKSETHHTATAADDDDDDLSGDESFEEQLAMAQIPPESRGDNFEAYLESEKKLGKSSLEILGQLGFKYLAGHLDTNEDADKVFARAIEAAKENKATIERIAAENVAKQAQQSENPQELVETNATKEEASSTPNKVEDTETKKDQDKADLLAAYLDLDDDDLDDDDDDDDSYDPADAMFAGGQSDSEDGELETDPIEILHIFSSQIRRSADYTEPRRKLPEINTEEDAIKLIENANKILVLSGAGISVACGVPDFRSPGGLYDQIKEKYNLTDPQLLFDINYIRKDQVPFYDFAAQLFPSTELKPSKAHKFIKMLQDKGKLLRNYSQNIDTLEQQVGILPEKLVLCHGSFATFSCPMGHRVDGNVIKPHLDSKKIPQCEVCNDPTGKMFMKPDIVFFGEALPDAFRQHVKEDVKEADLLIVMGSSLRVQPVALVPPLLGETSPTTPQLLFNRELVAQPHEFDYAFLVDCDSAVERVCQALGWEL